jgi:hypothetical protein
MRFNDTPWDLMPLDEKQTCRSITNQQSVEFKTNSIVIKTISNMFHFFLQSCSSISCTKRLTRAVEVMVAVPLHQTHR